MEDLAIRLIHACGMVDIADDPADVERYGSEIDPDRTGPVLDNTRKNALSATTRSLVDGLSAAAAAEGVPFAGDCEGGMFGFFLLPSLPSNYPQVMKTDGTKFNTLFHGLLDRGVYIAPALYEAGFVSGAHTAQDIADTVSAARDIFKAL
mgnify:CR=1 FL=1